MALVDPVVVSVLRERGEAAAQTVAYLAVRSALLFIPTTGRRVRSATAGYSELPP
jgi:hypothetical protein